jgi:hypothetical protein
MLSHISDFKDNVFNNLRSEDKIDPGTFSFMEPGWWALHATAVAGIYLLGSKLHNRLR